MANEKVIRTLRADKPKGERVSILGTDGLYVTVTPRGPSSYCYRYWSNGKPAFKPLGKFGVVTLGQAQINVVAARHAIEVEKHDLVDADATTKRAGTVTQLFERWRDEHMLQTVQPGTATSYEYIYNGYLKARIGDRMAARLKKAEITEAIGKIASEVSTTQARGAHAVLRAMMNWAESAGIIEVSKANRIPIAGRVKARQHAWSPDEIRRFWLAVSERPHSPTAQALMILILTGRRLSDVAEAKRADLLGLNSANPIWQIPSPKNDEPDAVALTPTLAMIFAHAAADDSEFVFAARAGSKQAHIDKQAITRERSRIIAKLGIRGVTTHDLRTTINSALADLRFDRDTRKGILGHKAESRDLISSTYLDTETLIVERAALQAYEDELRRLVAHPPKPHERWGSVDRTTR